MALTERSLVALIEGFDTIPRKPKGDRYINFGEVARLVYAFGSTETDSIPRQLLRERWQELIVEMAVSSRRRLDWLRNDVGCVSYGLGVMVNESPNSAKIRDIKKRIPLMLGRELVPALGLEGYPRKDGRETPARLTTGAAVLAFVAADLWGFNSEDQFRDFGSRIGRYYTNNASARSAIFTRNVESAMAEVIMENVYSRPSQLELFDLSTLSAEAGVPLLASWYRQRRGTDPNLIGNFVGRNDLG